MTTLLERFRRHVTRGALFPAPGTAIVCVSGGPDSVALLDLLASVARELDLRLVVAHTDHQIRADSPAVARAVRDLAARYDLPFELGLLGLGPGATETAARRARYAFLDVLRRRRRARYLVLGHHRDDQIETVLMRALRGSAPAGLAAMRARARDGIVRPLLPFTKAELAAHVTARGLPSDDDPANRDPRHLRSWIRSVLLPLLGARLGVRLGADLLHTAHAAAVERRAWDQMLEHLPGLELHANRDGFDVARRGLLHYDDTVGVMLLRAAARRAGLVLGMRRARVLLALAARPSGRRLSLRRGWSAEVAFDRLRVARARGVGPVAVAPSGERGHAAFGAFRVQWAPEPAPARFARAEWTTWIAGAEWQVRAPRPGDRLVPLGGVGHRPLRRLLMEARVPRTDRATYPIVARGKTILWVPGVCRSASDLPQPGTAAVRVDVTKHGELEADRRA